MTQEEIKAALEACDNATPGPWNARGEYIYCDGYIIAHFERVGTYPNARFAALARTALPAALAELSALRAKTACTMGVGDGGGNLYVHGDYDSIKAAQAIVLERDKLRAERDGLQAIVDKWSTKDGVPMEPGMIVWHTLSCRCLEHRGAHPKVVPAPFLYPVYSTEAAALAAREKEGE